MTAVVRGIAWLGILIGICVAPLAFALISIFTRHLPVGYQRFQFFACGPNPMLDAVETALVEIGTPADRIHTERFDWV